jgi:dolichyl-phosphate-mannose--protein O-mannosyl transferase
MIFNFSLLLLTITVSSTVANDPVTCGSVIKIIHKETGHHLHSHPIAWGSGSGQQSITTTGSNNDAGSLWIVKEASTSRSSCDVGAPIKCGDLIRLEHVSTGKNLHSHLFRAPLSGNQEVSGFGGENAEGSDSGDNWKIICDSGDSYWGRGSPVSFSHADTSKYLFSSGAAKFTASNCGQGCPIMGQNEVSAGPARDVKSRWETGQGIYFSPKSGNSQEHDDEL